jgi:hypothetical protein
MYSKLIGVDARITYGDAGFVIILWFAVAYSRLTKVLVMSDFFSEELKYIP